MEITIKVLWLDGATTKMTYANGTFTDYAYTNRGFLQSIANKKSDLSVISSFTYTLDSVGNRTGINEDTGEYVLYGYDNTYQLTSETRKDNLGATLFSASYEYDAVGNRTRMVKDSAQTLYTYNNMNQLLSARNVTFTYDANGNLISETENNQTTTYIWDYENKLKQITYPDLTTNTFTYNGDGLRTCLCVVLSACNAQVGTRTARACFIASSAMRMPIALLPPSPTRERVEVCQRSVSRSQPYLP